MQQQCVDHHSDKYSIDQWAPPCHQAPSNLVLSKWCWSRWDYLCIDQAPSLWCDEHATWWDELGYLGLAKYPDIICMLVLGFIPWQELKFTYRHVKATIITPQSSLTTAGSWLLLGWRRMFPHVSCWWKWRRGWEGPLCKRCSASPLISMALDIYFLRTGCIQVFTLGIHCPLPPRSCSMYCHAVNDICWLLPHFPGGSIVEAGWRLQGVRDQVGWMEEHCDHSSYLRPWPCQCQE